MIKLIRFTCSTYEYVYVHSCFFFFIFYSLQLFLAVVVGQPITHTAHLRYRSTGSFGYSNEVQPTIRLLPWPFDPVIALPIHNSQSQILGLRRLRQYMSHCICRSFATTSAATHLTHNQGFPIIQLSQVGGCLDPMESLAERQRYFPRGNCK